MSNFLFADDIAVVDDLQSTTDTLHKFILDRLPKPGTPLAIAALHHFATPGKMVRAKMALRAADLLKIDSTPALHWAVAIEVLHNASLIHDDICDGDQMRRDRPSVWSLHGHNVALTLGDWLIALSFELAAEAGQRSQTPLLVKILAQHMATTTAGEAAEFATQALFDWDSYLNIAADKTAPLLTAPLEGVAAMALHANAGAAIGTYFRSLGTAYQIANDILNFRALDGAADCGSDLARRAPNAVIVLYRQNLSPEQANEFDNWCVSGCNADLSVMQQSILKSDAMALSAHHMHKTLDQTLRYAQALPVGLSEIVAPVQALLKQICVKSVAPVDC
ncbi:MAG: polyprenyl synthetase family protein [Paracoccaceae bacterium]|nr:polyprenyl synthetase family protein [Paracoccaceae bacterium]